MSAIKIDEEQYPNTAKLLEAKVTLDAHAKQGPTAAKTAFDQALTELKVLKHQMSGLLKAADNLKNESDPLTKESSLRVKIDELLRKNTQFTAYTRETIDYTTGVSKLSDDYDAVETLINNQEGSASKALLRYDSGYSQVKNFIKQHEAQHMDSLLEAAKDERDQLKREIKRYRGEKTDQSLITKQKNLKSIQSIIDSVDPPLRVKITRFFAKLIPESKKQEQTPTIHLPEKHDRVNSTALDRSSTTLTTKQSFPESPTPGVQAAHKTTLSP